MKKIKIARIVASPLSFISLATLIEELSKNDKFEVHLISDKGSYLKIAQEKYPNVVFHIVEISREINLLKDIVALLKMTKIFLIEQFDIVHSHTPKAGLINSLAGLLSFRRVRIHTFTGQVWVDYKGLKKIFFKYIDKFICKANTFCYVDGHGQKQFLLDNKIGTHASLRVLLKGSLSGIDVKRFDSLKKLEKRKILRDQYFPNFEGKIILFLGRVNQDKGISELLEAFNNLRKLYPVKLLMVGPVEFLPMELKERFDLMCRGLDVAHIDFVTNTEDFYLASDIYCLPTYREGCPVTILEASAMKRPVVASRIYGVSDTVIENETALLFEVKNSTDLYEKLKILIEDEKLALQLGENGRDFIIKNFKCEDLAEELIKNYLNLYYEKT